LINVQDPSLRRENFLLLDVIKAPCKSNRMCVFRKLLSSFSYRIKLPSNKFNQNSILIKSIRPFDKRSYSFPYHGRARFQLMSSGLRANKIDRELFVNDQVPSLIVERLLFNKCQLDSVPIKRP
jgi:hypothetical protein